MIRVFCVDLGYSLKRECRKWEENAKLYPGQALYGINHFKQNNVEPIFEWCEHGVSWKNWFALVDEIIKAISLIKFYKEYDLIYIPHAHYSRWIIVLKMIGIIKKPVVVCLHNKNNLCGLIKACDYIITINPYLSSKLQKDYNKLNIKYIPLLPEKELKFDIKSKCKYDIVSIGNTYRDYLVLIKAMAGLPYSCLIITAHNIGDVPDNVTVFNENLSYEQCLGYYLQAEIVIVPIMEKVEKGVFGLTSLVDALYVEKPVIVTGTTGLGIEIKKNNLGKEVQAGSFRSMHEAISDLMSDKEKREQIKKNIKNFKVNNNMETSSKQICNIFYDIVNKDIPNMVGK